jgi:hypothetical protein
MDIGFIPANVMMTYNAFEFVEPFIMRKVIQGSPAGDMKLPT